jgi:hypothetical protein
MPLFGEIAPGCKLFQACRTIPPHAAADPVPGSGVGRTDWAFRFVSLRFLSSTNSVSRETLSDLMRWIVIGRPPLYALAYSLVREIGIGQQALYHCHSYCFYVKTTPAIPHGALG